jgi:hypothetical protein
MKTRQVSILSGIALATSGMVFGLCLPSSALTWDWSYSGGASIGGSGTFTTTDGPEPFTITGITGTAESQTITSLLPPGSFPLSSPNDNLLNTSQPQLTINGVSWVGNGESFNLFLLGGLYVLSSERSGGFLVDFSATQSQPPAVVPEPSLLLSFITLGGLMLGGAVRRVRK